MSCSVEKKIFKRVLAESLKNNCKTERFYVVVFKDYSNNTSRALGFRCLLCLYETHHSYY